MEDTNRGGENEKDWQRARAMKTKWVGSRVFCYTKTMNRVAVAVWLVCTVGGCAAPVGIVVPAYFYPGSLWSSMNWAAGRVPLVAIMNPNSGPGTIKDPQYVAAVNSLRAAGGKVIGYVSTSYTARATNAVKTDIDSYFSFYTVDGIFLDEFTNDSNTNHLNYYAGCINTFRRKEQTCWSSAIRASIRRRHISHNVV